MNVDMELINKVQKDVTELRVNLDLVREMVPDEGYRRDSFRIYEAVDKIIELERHYQELIVDRAKILYQAQKDKDVLKKEDNLEKITKQLGEIIELMKQKEAKQ